mmetsp:Transcript_37953/g.108415  ORF Transcript_37953/g.108415 Transcript_37953/m.108415 type:complete len:204 (-) Transcript_37953:738-1349(-)
MMAPRRRSLVRPSRAARAQYSSRPRAAASRTLSRNVAGASAVSSNASCSASAASRGSCKLGKWKHALRTDGRRRTAPSARPAPRHSPEILAAFTSSSRSAVLSAANSRNATPACTTGFSRTTSSVSASAPGVGGSRNFTKECLRTSGQCRPASPSSSPSSAPSLPEASPPLASALAPAYSSSSSARSSTDVSFMVVTRLPPAT